MKTIFNIPKNLTIKRNKIFSTYDIIPSILESLGITFAESSFGLGQSLFSENDTLISSLGAQKLNNLIHQNSEFYHKFNLPTSKRQNNFVPYQIGSTLREDDFLKYTDAYEEIANSYYLDRLNLELKNTNAKKA